jgi:hypothetical protein
VCIAPKRIGNKCICIAAEGFCNTGVFSFYVLHLEYNTKKCIAGLMQYTPCIQKKNKKGLNKKTWFFRVLTQFCSSAAHTVSVFGHVFCI